MPVFKLTLSYDGSRYNGWQRQGNTPDTIQEKIETLLSRLLSQTVEVAGSGRTDAGVHARAQVCSFRADTDMSEEALLSAIRRYLPEDIGAVSLELAPPRFHARLNCREKTYVYRIWHSTSPNVFLRKYMLNYPGELDISAMRRAAASLTGKHDYTSFNANKNFKKSPVRTVSAIQIDELGDELRFTFTGDGFLYNMVRILVGTLLEVGTGEREAGGMDAVFSARNRAAAGFTAPAHGLILWDVKY